MGDTPETGSFDPTDTGFLFGERKDPVAPHVGVLLTKSVGEKGNHRTIVFLADARREGDEWSIDMVDSTAADMEALKGISIRRFASKVEQVPPGYYVWGWFQK